MGVSKKPVQLHGDEEAVDVFSSEEDFLGLPPRPSLSRNRIVAYSCIALSVTGLFAVGMCALAASAAASSLHSSGVPPAQKQRRVEAKRPVPHHDQQRAFSAIDLLTSQEVLNLASQNLMTAGQVIFSPKDRQEAASTIKYVFGNVSMRLAEEAPQVAKELRRISLGQKEKDAMLKYLALLTNYEVQDLGRYVAKVIETSPVEEQDALRRFVESVMASRMDEVKSMSKMLIPSSLFALWGEGHPNLIPGLLGNRLGMTLDHENLAGLRDKSMVLSAEPQPIGGHGDDEQQQMRKKMAMFAGALQQARAMMDVLESCIRIASDEGESEWVTGFGGTFDFGYTAMTWPCQLGAAEDSELDDAMQSVFCHLKFGTMGMDMLKSTFISNMASLLPPAEDA